MTSPFPVFPPVPLSRARATLVALAYVALSVGLGTGVAVLAARLMPGANDDRLVKTARRCMMITAVLLLPLLLRVLGMRGARDAGWAATRGTAWPLFRRGLLVGIATLLPVVALSLITGSREWNLAYAPTKTFASLGLYLLSAGVVGVVEETLVRGFLFFPLRRAMGWIPAALASGALFAAAHFLKPSAAALRAPGFFSAVGETLATAGGNIGVSEHFLPHFITLTLMSVVLCAATVRTGSIWLAAGLHAGWVWIKRCNSILMDSKFDSPWQEWIGSRSDYLDGWGAAVLLAVLLLFLWPGRRDGRDGHAPLSPYPPTYQN